MKAFLFFLFLSSSFAFDQKPKIAIIGAGVSGASTAYFIEEKRQQLSSPDFQPTVDVFEKEDQAGGRVKDMVFTFQSKEYRMELGASVYHTTNQFLAHQHDEIKEADDKANILDDTADGKISSPTVGWWDGKQFVIQTDNWWLTDIASFLWKYGSTPVSSDNILQDIIGQFSQIYSKMALNKDGFRTPTDLIDSVGLKYLLNTTILENMVASGLDLDYVNEIVGSINRCNYGQGVGLNALAGWISQACQSKDLHSVSGGNSRMIKRMIATSGARLRLSTLVTDLQKTSDGYLVFYEKNGEKKTELYDAVIIASPLELNSISLSADIQTPPPIQYHTTHVTLVVGTADPSFFRKENKNIFNSGEKGVDIILTTDDSLIFSSFAAWKEVGDGQRIYKIFSKKELSQETLSSLFTTITTTYHKEWKAYPLLPPSPPLSSFVLQSHSSENGCKIGGVYYTNAMESLVSAMETQAIAAFNVVQLLSSSCSTDFPSSCEV